MSSYLIPSSVKLFPGTNLIDSHSCAKEGKKMATDQNTAGCVLTDDDYQAFHDVPWNRASDFLVSSTIDLSDVESPI